MVIQCSSCQTRFKLADDKIKSTGTKVRCTKCREVFTIFPAREPEVEATVTLQPEPPLPHTAAQVTSTLQQAAPSAREESVNDNVSFDINPSLPDNSPVQEDNSFNFSNESENSAASSDIDAINFDNTEPAVFSIKTEGPSELAFDFSDPFSDAAAFSFDETPNQTSISLPGTSNRQPLADQPSNSATITPPSLPETKNPFESSFDDFSADEALVVPQQTNPLEQDKFEESQLAASNQEFSFSATDNLADFSWEDTGDAASTDESGAIQNHGQQDKPTTTEPDFDFSSFSFDEVAQPSSSSESEPVADIPIAIDAPIETVNDEPPPPPVLNTRIPTEYPRQANPNNPPEAAQRTPIKTTRSRARQKSKPPSRLILKLIFLAILLMGFTYGLINRDKIQNSYKELVGRFIESQSPAEIPGRIGLEKLSGAYLSNNQEGELFIIQGEIVNEYKSLRSSILLKGSISGANGAGLQSQTAYAGNALTDNQLKKMTFKDIRDAMSNELGENLANLNIAPNKTVPFTIVFKGASKNIAEFTVEVVDSKPGSK